MTLSLWLMGIGLIILIIATSNLDTMHRGSWIGKELAKEYDERGIKIPKCGSIVEFILHFLAGISSVAIGVGLTLFLFSVFIWK